MSTNFSKVLWLLLALLAIASVFGPAAMAQDASTPNTGPTIAELMSTPFMTNFDAPDLSHLVAGSSVPIVIQGLYPVSSLLNTSLPIAGTNVLVPAVPADLAPYRFFPQDDPENPYPIWGVPLASYRDGDNWSCEATSGWCAGAIEAFQWRVWTGAIVCHPAVGCLQNPNGGAVSLLMVNLLDSNEVWDNTNDSGVYVVSGFNGFGQMFNMGNVDYNVGMALGTLRNHYLYNLGENQEYIGQCGSSKLCDSVLYVTVVRQWDRPEIGVGERSFTVVDAGIWTRPGTVPTAAPTATLLPSLQLIPTPNGN